MKLLPWWVCAVCAGLGAQDLSYQECHEMLKQRVERGEDLQVLHYRRDVHGVLEVDGGDGGDRPFAPMFGDRLLPAGGVAMLGRIGAAMMLAHDRQGLLGMTDAERHLRRIGVEPSPVALRQFLVAPWPAGDPDRARVEVLDRMLAIDWLVRHQQRGALAECTALATRADTPPPLAAQARVAMAAFGKGAEPRPPQRLVAATLGVPTVVDALLMIDHRRLPDLTPLPALLRRLAVDASYRLYDVLRAPTPADLFFGSYRADVLGELPYELVRRCGMLRCDHTVVALQARPTDPQVPLAFLLQSAGAFDADAAALRTVAAEAAPDAEVECAANRLACWSKGMAGRPAPELAATLLAEGPALRLLVPSASRLWAGLAFLKLPPAEQAELTVAFAGSLRVEVAVTVRDEIAAEAWQSRGQELLAEGLELARGRAAAMPAETARLQPVLAALAATELRTEGRQVRAVVVARDTGWDTLQALRSVVRPR